MPRWSRPSFSYSYSPPNLLSDATAPPSLRYPRKTSVLFQNSRANLILSIPIGSSSQFWIWQPLRPNPASKKHPIKAATLRRWAIWRFRILKSARARRLNAACATARSTPSIPDTNLSLELIARHLSPLPLKACAPPKSRSSARLKLPLSRTARLPDWLGLQRKSPAPHCCPIRMATDRLNTRYTRSSQRLLKL